MGCTSKFLEITEMLRAPDMCCIMFHYTISSLYSKYRRAASSLQCQHNSFAVRGRQFDLGGRGGGWRGCSLEEKNNNPLDMQE